MTHHRGTKGVTVFVGRAVAHHLPHVGRHLAQFRFAGMSNLLRDAIRVHPLFDLAVVHQAQRLPIGGRLRSLEVRSLTQSFTDLQVEPRAEA